MIWARTAPPLAAEAFCAKLAAHPEHRNSYAYHGVTGTVRNQAQIILRMKVSSDEYFVIHILELNLLAESIYFVDKIMWCKVGGLEG